MATTTTWSTDMLPTAESRKGNHSSSNKNSSMALHYQVNKDTMGDITKVMPWLMSCLATTGKGYINPASKPCSYHQAS